MKKTSDTQQFEFENEHFRPWKELLIILVLSFAILPLIGAGLSLTETYAMGAIFSAATILSLAFVGASIFIWAVSNRHKLRRRYRVKMAFIKYGDTYTLSIQQKHQIISIPLSEVRNHSLRTHKSRLDNITTIQWVIRYLPRHRISFSISGEDIVQNKNFGDMMASYQMLDHTLDITSNHTAHRKTHFIDTPLASVIAWMLALGFLVFSVVSAYLTGRGSISLWLLTFLGITTPLIGLKILRENSADNEHTTHNPNSQIKKR